MVHQRDPVNQLSTNAKVMAYLLQPENNFYETYGSVGEPLAGREFLKLLIQIKPRVRVLLDVGAQMLDMRNAQLVKYWLSISDPEIKAAVFFDESNNPCIMGRDGNVTAFSSSPFSEKLDVCIVYLDDAHTRGTDLRLPSNTRAAVTLGPKVTKDRLVQGTIPYSSSQHITTDQNNLRVHAHAEARPRAVYHISSTPRNRQENPSRSYEAGS
jgi:hypothetical protein